MILWHQKSGPRYVSKPRRFYPYYSTGLSDWVGKYIIYINIYFSSIVSSVALIKMDSSNHSWNFNCGSVRKIFLFRNGPSVRSVSPKGSFRGLLCSFQNKVHVCTGGCVCLLRSHCLCMSSDRLIQFVVCSGFVVFMCYRRTPLYCIIYHFSSQRVYPGRFPSGPEDPCESGEQRKSSGTRFKKVLTQK